MTTPPDTPPPAPPPGRRARDTFALGLLLLGVVLIAGAAWRTGIVPGLAVTGVICAGLGLVLGYDGRE